MDEKFDDIRLLTLDEAAALLQVSKRTLQRMIKISELPAFKVGGQWRLRETQLRQWVEHRQSSGMEGERKGCLGDGADLPSEPFGFFLEDKTDPKR
jgi:excisionase family DNA binding protein